MAWGSGLGPARAGASTAALTDSRDDQSALVQIGRPAGDGADRGGDLIEQVVAKGEAQGPEMLSFGDGHDELEAVKDFGGVAVGLATLEPACDRIDEWKRQRLIESGADYIIPNYLCWDELKEHLFAH